MTGDDQYSSIYLFPEIGQPTWVELITANYLAPHTLLHRELADPSLYPTVRQLALALGVNLVRSLAYLRHPGHRLEPIYWLAPLVTGMSLVVVPDDLPADGLTRVRQELQYRPEILPERMMWPIV